MTVVHVEYPVRGAVGNQKFGSKIKIEGRCVCWLTVMAELVMEFLDFKIDFFIELCSLVSEKQSFSEEIESKTSIR